MHKQPGGQSFDEDRSGDIIFGGQSFGRYGRIISGKKNFAQRREFWRRYLEMVKLCLGMRAQIMINSSRGDSLIMIREMLI